MSEQEFDAAQERFLRGARKVLEQDNSAESYDKDSGAPKEKNEDQLAVPGPAGAVWGVR